MKTLYLVMGSTGEYSGRDEWPVCAYEDEAQAQQHVVKAVETARAIQATKPGWPYELPPNPYDPYMQMYYTGTTYWLAKVELREALPDETPQS